MKNVIVCSALAAACGAALAQDASVTIYGLVDAGLSQTTGVASGNEKRLVSGIMEGSRLGFRGSEDIGGGYRALFTLESRIELNNGTWGSRPQSGTQLPDRLNTATLLGLPAALQPVVNQVAPAIGSTIGVNLGNAVFDRQAYVGLVTPVGAVLLGRQYTPAYQVIAAFDALATQSSLAAGQVSAIPASVDIRANSAVAYVIQKGPITASAMYAFGEVSGSSSANRLMGLMAIYKTDSYSFGAGYNTHNNELGDAALKSTIIGATVNVGPGTLSGLIGTIKDDHPAGLSAILGLLTQGGVPAGTAAAVQSAFIEGLKQDARQFQIGYKTTFGPNTVYVAYNRFDDKRAANADVDSYGVVYSYAMSKRTDLNFVLTHFNNKNLAQAAPGQAGFLGGFTKSAGTDSDNIAFGIRHRF